MVDTAPESIESAISAGYKIALCKQPDAETLDILLNLYQNANTELKGELVSAVTEEEVRMDAMGIVANAIMNLDEFVTKE